MKYVVLAAMIFVSVSLDASASRIYESLKVAICLHQMRVPFARLVLANDAAEQKINFLYSLHEKHEDLHIKRSNECDSFLFDKLGSDMYHLQNRIKDVSKDLEWEEIEEVFRAFCFLAHEHTKKCRVLDGTFVQLDDNNPVKKELDRSGILFEQARRPIVYYNTRRLL